MSPSETRDEVAQFKQYVLTGAWSQRIGALAADIVWRQENHSTADIAVCLDLFNDCAALIGLLAQDNGLKPGVSEFLCSRRVVEFVFA